MDAKQILREVFGYEAFRGGQEPLIRSILSGRDTLGIMPTGAGKSLCYQVPALAMEGITVVVSPLISLMKDQVEALIQAGVPAAYLNSSLTPAQFQKAMERTRAGAYKILYAAPERLETESFLSFAKEAEISMVCVDEAHCVSQWGQDFRPSYRRIPELIRALSKRPVVSAFTATATAQVRDDIVRLLELSDPFVLTTGFDRPNLYFEVQQPKDKQAALLKILNDRPGRSAIVYCATRKGVEEVTERLLKEGISAARYHAGLSEEERRENQEDFLYDRKTVMVATNAFGMGIDKSNVSLVVHYNMPKNPESYYQEAGRAGRDGSAADCILLYSGQDVVTDRFLIDKAGEDGELDPETAAAVRALDLERLKTMTFYCHTAQCLRGYLLRYFGEEAPETCGNCSNCLKAFEVSDVTVEAQKILSCVSRMRQRFGVKMVCDVLRGSKSERIRQLGLDRLSIYGLLSNLPETSLREIIRGLQEQELLRDSGGEYPVLKLTEGSLSVLRGGAEGGDPEKPCPCGKNGTEKEVGSGGGKGGARPLRKAPQFAGGACPEAAGPGLCGVYRCGSCGYVPEEAENAGGVFRGLRRGAEEIGTVWGGFPQSDSGRIRRLKGKKTRLRLKRCVRVFRSVMPAAAPAFSSGRSRRGRLQKRWQSSLPPGGRPGLSSKP